MRLALGYQLKSKIAFWSVLGDLLKDAPIDVMLSFSEFHKADPVKVSNEIKEHFADFTGRVLLDNGAYGVDATDWRTHSRRYLNFVSHTEDVVSWRPIPFDFIPGRHFIPTCRESLRRFERLNRRLVRREFVPVVHLGSSFQAVLERLLSAASPRSLAIGGAVPFTMRKRGFDWDLVAKQLAYARNVFSGTIHAFGLGGCVGMVEFARDLLIDSIDSSGWRLRAAFGKVLVPKRAQRAFAGKTTLWARNLREKDAGLLVEMGSPIFNEYSLADIAGGGKGGTVLRALHNAWVLVDAVSGFAINALSPNTASPAGGAHCSATTTCTAGRAGASKRVRPRADQPASAGAEFKMPTMD